MEAIVMGHLDFEAELRAAQARRSAGRSAGRHQSEIIHRIVKRLEPARFGGKGGIDPVLAEGGFLWEDALSRAFARRYSSKQVEVESDGIWQTLDDFNVKDWRVVEFKMTKMSASNEIRSRKFAHWHFQIMGYCRTMQTLEAELVPLFINGSYELGGGRFGEPVVGKKGHPYLLRYSRREIEENWAMLLRERDAMDKEEGRRR